MSRCQLPLISTKWGWLIHTQFGSQQNSTKESEFNVYIGPVQSKKPANKSKIAFLFESEYKADDFILGSMKHIGFSKTELLSSKCQSILVRQTSF
jgi:hypothetical protein